MRGNHELPTQKRELKHRKFLRVGCLMRGAMYLDRQSDTLPHPGHRVRHAVADLNQGTAGFRASRNRGDDVNRCVIGMDVSHQRGCACAVLDRTESRILETIWLRSGSEVKDVNELAARYPSATFALDAPRMVRPTKRDSYWSNKGGWRRRKPGESGRGRHCEVVIKACEIANPQWTPIAGAEFLAGNGQE